MPNSAPGPKPTRFSERWRSPWRRAGPSCARGCPTVRCRVARIRRATAADGFLDPATGTGAALTTGARASRPTPAPRPGRGARRLSRHRVAGPRRHGRVYRAHDSSLGRDVAIKVLPRAVAGDSTRLARFRREARLLASLNHPNIAAIYTVVEDESRLALVLELVEGPTLAERLSDGPLPLAQALQLARQVADAMDAAHQKGVVHRDLKPANIKVTGPAGQVLDFGIAKAISDEGSHDGDPSLTGTGHRALLGTAAYMSRSRRGARRWTTAPTSGPSAASSSRCSPGSGRSRRLGRRRARPRPRARSRFFAPAARPALVGASPAAPHAQKQPRRRLGYIARAARTDDALAVVERGARTSSGWPTAGGGASGRGGGWPGAGHDAGPRGVGVVAAPARPAADRTGLPVPPIRRSSSASCRRSSSRATAAPSSIAPGRARRCGCSRALRGVRPVALPGTDDVSGHALAGRPDSGVRPRRSGLARARVGGRPP